MVPRRGTRRREWLLTALLTAVALAASAALWVPSETTASLASGVPSSVNPLPPATPVPATPGANPASETFRVMPRAKPGPPQRVVVRSLGIDADVTPIAAEGNALNPPADPQQLGWWSGGAEPGAVRGSALITGHTVSAGGGAMDDLEKIAQRAPIRVKTPRSTIRYVAVKVRVLSKERMAAESQRLFSQESSGRLVLVTCEDWDGTGYRSNVVVTALPVSRANDGIGR